MKVLGRVGKPFTSLSRKGHLEVISLSRKEGKRHVVLILGGEILEQLWSGCSCHRAKMWCGGGQDELVSLTFLMGPVDKVSCYDEPEDS